MGWVNETSKRLIDSISFYLPDRIRCAVGSIKEESLAEIEEIRIRKTLPLMGVFCGKDFFIGVNGELSKAAQEGLIVSPREMEELFLLLCDHSIYAYQEEISKGFITLKGGHRAGICGTVVYNGDKIVAMKDISSVNIRFSRQIKGCAQEVLQHIIRNSSDIYNTLILSPPRLGKTTLLRDICRLISQGVPSKNFIGLRTAVVDERSELAASYRGVAQNDLGPRADVLDGCRKSDGIEIILRAMAPQVIIVDELGAAADAQAIGRAWNAGVRIIATAHAFGIEDIKKRFESQARGTIDGFERFIVLGIDKGKRNIKVMDGNGCRISSTSQNDGMLNSICRMHSNGNSSFKQACGEAASLGKTFGGTTRS